MSKYTGWIGTAQKSYEFVFKYKKVSTDPGNQADKSALEKAIADAKAIENKNYTDDSWNALQKAIEKAESVFANENATQTEVNAQITALENAVNALTEKTPEVPENPDPENPNKPETDDQGTGDTAKPEGNKVVFEKGSKKGIRFFTGIDFDEFKSVMINGKVVDSSNYTLKESSDGKAIIILKSSYLEKLGNGEYTFTVVSKDGTTEKATFVVKGALSESAIPKTADTAQPFVYVMGMFAAVGVYVVVLRRKRAR